MSAWRRKLLVVEDEPLVASLLCDVLAKANFEPRSASNAAEARALVDTFDPDCALIDINLGRGPTGLHLGQILRRTHPEIGLVFLTRYQDPRLSGEKGMTVPEGSAFLSKDRISDPSRLTQAIESVLSDAKSIDRDDRGDAGELSGLTEIQLEILRFAALGLTNAAIARRRETTERTVEQRLQSVYVALGIDVTPDVNPRVEAIRRYIAAAGIPSEYH